MCGRQGSSLDKGRRVRGGEERGFCAKSFKCHQKSSNLICGLRSQRGNRRPSPDLKVLNSWIFGLRQVFKM